MSWFKYKIIKEIYQSYPLSFESRIRTALSGCQTILDIGCGTGRLKTLYSNADYCGIELHKASADIALRSGYIKIISNDVNKALSSLPKRSYDACVAIDLIEHLEYKDGIKLLNQMETVARKVSIIHTPNGYVPQKSINGNRFQVHISGWSPDFFLKRGYKLYGTMGLKWFRSEQAIPVLKPAVLGSIISFATEPFTVLFPNYAFEILAIKNLTSNNWHHHNIGLGES